MSRFCIFLLLLLTCLIRQLSAQPEQPPTLSDSLAYLPPISPSEDFLDLKASLKRAEEQHNVSEIAEICYQLGKRYNGAGYYKIARYWYLHSLRIREPRGPSNDLVKLYIQLSGNYTVISNLEKSRQYIILALNTARNIRTADSTKALKSVYIMMGGLHSEACRQSPKNLATQDFERMYQQSNTLPGILGKWMSCDSCFYYNRLARQKLRILQEYDAITDNLARISLLKGDTLRAIRYFKTRLADQTHAKGSHVRISIQTELAGLYIAIHKPKQGLYLLDDALQQYKQYQFNAPTLLQQIHATYVLLYHLTGEYQKAFYYQKLSYEYLFQKLDGDRDGAIERLSIEYDMEKRDAEIKLQQKLIGIKEARITAEQKVKYGLSGILLVAIGVGIAFYRLSQKNRRISEDNLELVKEQNHRVKNNLQAVSDLLTLQKFQLTDKVALEAITESQLRIQSMNLLHEQLYDNPEHIGTVELKCYIPELVTRILQTYGLENIQPVYTVEDIWLPANQMLRLGLILTETVTNSCKYALANHPAPVLSIQVKQKATTVQLIVQDNGPGFIPPQGEVTTYGLTLINIQVRQLQGTHTFKSNNGTRFELVFTLEKRQHHSRIQ